MKTRNIGEILLQVLVVSVNIFPKLIFYVQYIQIEKYIEKTMLMSFDIKFNKQGQKQCRSGEACGASLMCFRSCFILKSKEAHKWFSFYHASSSDFKE